MEAAYSLLARRTTTFSEQKPCDIDSKDSRSRLDIFDRKPALASLYAVEIVSGLGFQAHSLRELAPGEPIGFAGMAQTSAKRISGHSASVSVAAISRKRIVQLGRRIAVKAITCHGR